MVAITIIITIIIIIIAINPGRDKPIPVTGMMTTNTC